jgi:hypothetical protein
MIGMMQRIMVALYNGDVCEADACVAWKDNTDDAVSHIAHGTR